MLPFCLLLVREVSSGVSSEPGSGRQFLTNRSFHHIGLHRQALMRRTPNCDNTEISYKVAHVHV